MLRGILKEKEGFLIGRDFSRSVTMPLCSNGTQKGVEDIVFIFSLIFSR